MDKQHITTYFSSLLCPTEAKLNPVPYSPNPTYPKIFHRICTDAWLFNVLTALKVSELIIYN